MSGETPVAGPVAPVRSLLVWTGRMSFLARLTLWLAMYATLALCWGSANSWIPILAVPATLVLGQLGVAVFLYRRMGIRMEDLHALSEWEVLIAFLLLAIGVASGGLFLMSVGWVSLGVALLRPRGAHVSWEEWFKLPACFLFSLPIYFDLAGSRHDWLLMFHQQQAASSELKWGNYLEFEVAFKFLLGFLVIFLRGGAFWVFMPVLAGAFILQGWATVALGSRPDFGFTSYSLLALGALAGLIMVVRSGRLAGLWSEIIEWALGRTYSVWLAALVILLQQSTLIEGWLAGREPRFHLFGTAFLLALLGFARTRYAEDRVQIRSKLMLVGALLTLLVAEWVDFDPGRHLSLGMMLISLTSWRRPWPPPLFFGSLLAWISLIPANRLTPSTFADPVEVPIRLVLFVGGAALCLQSILQPQDYSYQRSVDSYWQPTKRFSLIVLAMLLGFQTMSTIWPDDRRDMNRSPEPKNLKGLSLTPPGRVPALTDVHQESRLWRGGEIRIWLATPSRQPIGVQAPEWLAQTEGWKVLDRDYLRHPLGQCMALKLARGGERATAIYWFSQGTKTFASFQRARRVLWSGWNLTRRELSLVYIQSSNVESAAELLAFAKAENSFWRRAPGD